MKELDRFSGLATFLPADALAAEVEAEKRDVLAVTVANGQPAGAAASDLTALFVRVSGEKTGTTYTQNLEEDPALLLGKAFANASLARTAGPEPMNSPVSAGHSFCEAELTHEPIDKLKHMAAGLEQAITAQAGSLTFSKVILSETINTVGLVNTLGCDMAFSRKTCEAEVVLVQENSGHYIYNEILTAPSLDDLQPDYFLLQLSRFKAAQLPITGCPAGSYRAVLDGSVICNILATAWQLFSAPFYLAKNTPLAGRLGEQLFTDVITIRDCPILPGSGYQMPFDCEGSAGRDVMLVSRGRLEGLLQTLASASAMSLPATGNAGRKTLMSGTVHTQTAAMPKNFTLMPGEAKREALIASLEDGIYIQESYDVFHSINIASGDFSIPCKGIVVKNGEMTGLAEGLTMSGNVCDLLAGVEAIADDVRVWPMVMLKSYTVAAPSLLVRELRISGETNR